MAAYGARQLSHMHSTKAASRVHPAPTHLQRQQRLLTPGVQCKDDRAETVPSTRCFSVRICHQRHSSSLRTHRAVGSGAADGSSFSTPDSDISRAASSQADSLTPAPSSGTAASLSPAAPTSSSAANLPVGLPGPGLTAKVAKFVLDQFLPLGLLVGMVAGYLHPSGGLWAASLGMQTYTTTGIFLISGLGLRRGEALRALSARGAVAYGFAAILALTPLAGLAALRLPLQPRALALGLAVFCCMPTTLSSGVSLTQAVGGNAALALLLTVGTNLAGIFTMPFVLARVLGSGAGAVTLQPGPLLVSLVKTILAPLLVGAAARGFVPGVAAAVDANKRPLALLSATLLCLVPWMQISRAVTSGVQVNLGSLAAVVAAGVAIHLVYLAFNMTAVRVLRLGGPDASREAVAIRRAVVLVGSQKTLPIAVTVLGSLGTALLGGPAAAGLAVVPCVASHLCQIVVDSLLVSRWLAADRRQAA